MQIEALSLEDLINKVEKFMTEGEYGCSDLHHYKQTWRRFSLYAAEKGIVNYSVQLGNDYLKDCYEYDLADDITRKKGYVKRIYRHIQVLSDYYLHGIVYKHRRKNYVWPDCLSDIFEEYLKFRCAQGRVSGSMKCTKGFLCRLAQYLMTENITSFADINEQMLEGFVKSLSGYALRTISRSVDDLRCLLEYAFENSYHPRNLKKACPRIREYKNTSIPSTFTADEIRSVLEVIDRESPVGMRDYAIFLIAVRLGLREGDILNLRFVNIDWENKSIQIVQRKTQQPLVLPLLDEVAWAIIDYLKNGRPICDCDHVFVRHHNPIAPLCATYDIVQKYIRRASIPLPAGKRHGLHALRHSLASKMLEQGATLPLISGVLGHLSSDTTKYYLKVDVNQLRQCALEVEE